MFVTTVIDSFDILIDPKILAKAKTGVGSDAPKLPVVNSVSPDSNAPGIKSSSLDALIWLNHGNLYKFSLVLRFS